MGETVAMDRAQKTPAAETGRDDTQTFGSALSQSRDRSATPWIVSGLVVLGLVLALILTGRHGGTAQRNQLQPEDAYAASLQLSNLTMSESTSLSGGKSTFLDGTIRNTGQETVSGVTVQVVFANDEAMPPRVETTPLMLIRTREPYVDTQTVSAAPIRPGESREFRLIFESLPQNWNTQLPQIRVTHVAAK